MRIGQEMAKFRKKPVVIEAVQLRWGNWSEMCEFAGVGFLKDGKPEGCFVKSDGTVSPHMEFTDRIGLQIPTLEGVMLGVENDWIIRGVQGELYPCKPDIFLQTYEQADTEACECCGQQRDELPYTSRNDIAYCQVCWDTGCDLVECSVR
jgi:hypothetical protein